MALLECSFFSRYLSYTTKAAVFLPERDNWKKAPERGKVLYLLHGRGDNHDSWIQNTQIALFAQEHGVTVVMPAGEDSFYTDAVCGKRYFSYIAEELPEFISGTFKVSDKREDVCIAGLSMGGYRALKIALTYPEKFGAVGFFSAAIRPDQMPDFCQTDLDRQILKDNLERVFGRGKLREEDDPYCLLRERRKEGRELPQMYQYIGKQDFLYEMNRKFSDFLDEVGQPVTYEEWDGIHDWYFWNKAIEKMMKAVYDKGEEK